MSEDNEVAGQDPLADTDDDEALFLKIKAWHKESADHLAEWREQAREDYAFVAGDQWTADERNMLREANRPEVSFNRIGPVVKSVAGMEVGNRQEVKYLPRQIQDSGFDEMLSNAAKFFRDESEAEDEESDAFYDCIVCGFGATETRPDFEEDPDGLIVTDRIDPMSAWYDTSARKRNVTDRRFSGYDKDLSLDEAKAMFPAAEEADLDASWARPNRPDEQMPHDADVIVAYNQGSQTPRHPERKRVTVVFCEWWDREQYIVAIDPFMKQRVEMPKSAASTLKKRLGKFGVPLETVTLSRKVFKQAFVGKRVLDTGPARCKDWFSLNFMTGDRDRNKNTWYGLVRAMKDPQRWANKFFSQIMHIINSNAKGGIIAETDAFVNVRKAEEDWARADGIIWANPGTLSKEKIKDRQPITYPAGLDQLMQYAVTAIRDTTGVNLELLGLADRDQAGVLEYQRKQSGIAILGTLFDSLRRYRKQQGKCLLYIIQTYIPENRLIRIDSDNGPKYAPLLKDPSNTKYDVIVDESPTSPNQKEAVWMMLMQMMPIIQRANLPGTIWAEILKYSPIPDSLAVKVGQALQQPQPQPPDPKIQAMQLKAQLDQAADQRAAEREKMRAQQEMQENAQRAQAEFAESQQDATLRRQTEHAQFIEELQRNRMKAAQDIELMKIHAATELDLLRKRSAVEIENAKAIAQAKASQIRKQPVRA